MSFGMEGIKVSYSRLFSAPLLQEAHATYREIGSVAIPFILQQVLQTLYTLVDLWWLGRLSTEAVAAVTAASSLLFFILAFVIGAAIAASVRAGQAHGAGIAAEHKACLVWSKVVLGFTVGVAAAALGIVVAPFFLPMLGIPSVSLLYSLATEYFFIVMGGVPLLAVTVVAMSVLQAIGKQWYGPMANLGGVLLNAVLDPIFLFLLLWDVKGVAVATILVQGVVASVLLFFLWREVGPPLHLSLFRSHLRDTIRSYLTIGLTATGEMLARAISSIVFVALVAPFGASALAAYGTGNQVYVTVILVFLGIAFAVGTLSARAVGAKDFARVVRYVRWGMVGNAVALAVVGVVVWFLAPHIAAQFLPNDPAAQRLAVSMLRWVFGGLWLLGMMVVIVGALRAMGHGMLALAVALSYLAVQFSVAWLVSRWTPLGVEGVWMAYPASFLVGAALAVASFLKVQ